MGKQFEICDESGERLMSLGFQKNVDAWFDQHPWMGEVRRRDAAFGVTALIVRDVRDTVAA